MILYIGGSRGARDAPCPISFIFKQFSNNFRPKICKINGKRTNFGSWQPLRKILDPPLLYDKIYLSSSELNSLESTESIEFVEDFEFLFLFSKILKIIFYNIYKLCTRLFLVIFILKTTKIAFYKFYRFCRFYSVLKLNCYKKPVATITNFTAYCTRAAFEYFQKRKLLFMC